ncbi:BZ3500_MvSof-1268-A1-R1_Chr9g10445 [Microbotryum saponariae]|uniref:BZ3500_MvSof-1268-A1-R1_Chr9g10445 protein n=1 Tax=Microbotryum saponariae TaxID=289078 RepID=A0A2X0LUJ9_9BASI|nr:BZ3501_MvSof-1269-A2-R1_Chr9g10195 [Microbotryum saponariae]SDA00105.1 BZ3500_MvSof-1268-A1-R1_Chr9g10445 [Microbotryum saponariae]
MQLFATLLLASTTTVVLAASSSTAAQLRLSPDPSASTRGASSSSRGGEAVALTAQQANAVLAHHLGVAQYERLPSSSSNKGNVDDKWQAALGVGPQWTTVEGQKVVIVLECGQYGCQDAIPSELSQSQPYELPSLPVHSWLSAVSLHLHRLAASLGIDPKSSKAVLGLEQLTESIKSVAGWAGWVGDELGSAIGWAPLKHNFKAAVEPVRSSLGLLSDVDLLDKSSATLVTELESLSNMVESLAASVQSNDNGPQAEKPQIVALHLKGLKEVAAAHSPSSETYQRAATLLRSTLSATLAALRQDAATDEQPTVLLLTLPPYSPPLLRRRAPFLAPFASSPAIPGQVARRGASMHLPHQVKRASVFVDHPTTQDGRVKRAPSDSGKPRQPVVPSHYRCFESEAELNNLTASCLGRGVGVKGVSAARNGGTADCWVCSCGKTTEEGKTKSWAGQGCEKEDLSGGVGLLGILFVSVGLLYGVGNVQLPGTLASVNGAGVGSKRD